MMLWGYGYSGSMLLWMFLGNIFWLAILGAFVWIVFKWGKRQLTNGAFRDTFHAPSAVEILRQRYARGEIDTATFNEMLGHLEKETDDYSVKI